MSSKLLVLLLRDKDDCRERAESDSPLARSFRDRGSLPSRFTPDRVVDVADLMRAIALLGPLETLRRCICSVDNARCSVRLLLGGAGRFVAAPGFCSRLLDDRLNDLD